MNLAIGNENELKVIEEYFNLFNHLFTLISHEPIEVKLIIQKLLKNGYDELKVKESIEFLLSKKYLVITEKNYNFYSNKIKLNKRPFLNLLEENESSYTEIIMSLPPFNIFGLKDALNSHEIQFKLLKDEIKKMFSEAEHSIYICSPFIEFNGINDFLRILKSKSKKGVEIKIIARQISKNDPQNRYNEIKRVYDSFQNEGCEIKIRNYHYQLKDRVNSSTHAKFIVCDYKDAYIGSGELRRNSYEKNFELGVKIKDKKARELGIIFDELFSVAKDIDWGSK